MINSGIMNQGGNDGFSLIWYYWFKKYMSKKGKKNQNPQQLINLKKKYHIEAIQSSSSTNSSIQQKLDAISDRSSQSPLPPSQAMGIYTINPAAQAHQIEQLILKTDDPQETKDLINELYSYYLNSNNVYIIYRQEREDLVMEPISKIINEDDSLGERNDSFMGSFDKIQNKIQHLELLQRLAEFDGVEIWDAKYMGIPHSFVKTKKLSWARGLNRPITHPSQPRTISQLPIIPRITPFIPSSQKLMPFISFMKKLEEMTPDTNSLPMPTTESIFQYNSLPYIFVQDYKQESIAVLCFYIVFGDEEGTITQGLVDRWMEDNLKSQLTKIIKQMKERYRNRNRYAKDGVSRGLGLLTGLDSHGNQIW